MKEIIITQAEAGQRFDKYLFKYFNTAPKSFIYKMLRKKRIKLNGKKAEGCILLMPEDRIGLFLATETMGQFMEKREVLPAKEVDIIYEDVNLLLMNKPSGVLSHPGSKEDRDTLIDRALFYLDAKNGFDRGEESTFTPALCNRLDRNTSGIVICGKNLGAVQALSKAIESRAIDKYYLTLVKGRVKGSRTLRGIHSKDEVANKAAIRGLEANAPNEERTVDIKENREAITSYESLGIVAPVGCSFEISLLRVKLVTGRSHQIRVHLSSVGYPVLGDPKYGDKTVNQWLSDKYGIRNQLLHSEKIIFVNTEGILYYLQDNVFTCPLKDGFRDLVLEYFPTYEARNHQ